MGDFDTRSHMRCAHELQKFDAQYSFNRVKIFRRDVGWAKYKTLIVTEIGSHYLVFFIPTLQPCHCKKQYRGFTFEHIVMMLMLPMMMVM